MTDGDALRRAVVESPDDDLPRLVYADWLDENGRPDRAAFIRAQVEAARAEPFSPAARAAAERASRIVGKGYRDDWTRHLRGRVAGSEFVRGFVGLIEVDAKQFPQVAAAVFAVEPVQTVRVERPAGLGWEWVPLEPVFELPQLRQVTSLELPRLWMQGLEYDALAASPHLAGLRDLSLRGNPVPPPWLTEFLAGPAVPALSGLCVADVTNVGPALAAGLTRAGHRRLARLDASGVGFNSDDLAYVLGSACLGGVEELRLGWGGWPNPGPLTHLDLGWVIPWGRLRVLDLAGHRLCGQVEEIARVPEAAKLRRLGLASNDLTPAAVEALVSSRHLNLYHLDVRGNGLDPDRVAALRERFPDAVVVA